MLSYIKQYKPFLLFLGKFMGSYIILIFVYQLFLDQFDRSNYEPDSMTTLVAYNTRDLIRFAGYEVALLRHDSEPSYRIFVNNHSVARIVEGCNAISVMILFVAFVIAFRGSFKRTVLFIIFGIILLHLLNVGRVAALVLGLVHYPQFEHLMHDIVFPLFIYGVVFALWVIWINKFSLYARKTQ